MFGKKSESENSTDNSIKFALFGDSDSEIGDPYANLHGGLFKPVNELLQDNNLISGNFNFFNPNNYNQDDPQQDDFSIIKNPNNINTLDLDMNSAGSLFDFTDDEDNHASNINVLNSNEESTKSPEKICDIDQLKDKTINYFTLIDLIYEDKIDFTKMLNNSSFSEFIDLLESKGMCLEDMLLKGLLDFRLINANILNEIDDIASLVKYPYIIRALLNRDDIPNVQNQIYNMLTLDDKTVNALCDSKSAVCWMAKNVKKLKQNFKSYTLETQLKLLYAYRYLLENGLVSNDILDGMNYVDVMENFISSNQDKFDKDIPLDMISFDYYAEDIVEISEPFQNVLNKFSVKAKNPYMSCGKIKYFHDLYRADTPYLFEMRTGIYDHCVEDKKLWWSNKIMEGNGHRTQELTNLISGVKNNRGLTLYRGLSGYKTIDYMANLPVGTFGVQNLNIIKGKVLFDRSFLSSTIGIGRSKFYSMDADGGVILMIDIPNDVSLNLMPIANENSEVVLNRYQKFKVRNVKYSSMEKLVYISCTALEDDDDIEEKIYKTPKFKQYQEEFEINLGKYLYQQEGSTKDGKAYRVVQEAIECIKNQCPSHEVNKHEYYRKRFYSNQNHTGSYYAGNIADFGGHDLSDDELDAVLSDAIASEAELKSNSTTIPGNFREKMAALSFALDNMGPQDSIKSFSALSLSPLFLPMDICIGSGSRDESQKETLRREFNYQDNIGLTRSPRELRYQSKYSPKDENGEFLNKSPIVYGGMYYKPKYHDSELDSFYGKRLVSGTSGLADKLLRRYRDTITDDKKKLLNFRLALMAYMLPEKESSLYEILVGSHMVDVIGSENVSTADTMDRTIDPLDEGTIRSKVCRDGKFPYELAYEDYVKNKKIASTLNDRLSKIYGH